MRKIIWFVHTSVDGFIDGPGGAFDWASLGPELAEYSYALDARAESLMYGRGVWEMMSGYWPNAESISDHPHDLKYAPLWRVKPKVVVSRTVETTEWNTRVVQVEDVEALKQEPGGDLLLMGGSALAAALTERGLIDEYHVAIHPVVLGGGRPLFAREADRLKLTLAGSTPCDGQIVVLDYRPR